MIYSLLVYKLLFVCRLHLFCGTKYSSSSQYVHQGDERQFYIRVTYLNIQY